MSKEFVEKDSKVGYIITIILLVLVVIGLGGFIGYKYYVGNDKCNAPIEKVEEKTEVYELTYSKAEDYIEKIKVYNNEFYNNFLVKNKEDITNDEYLTFAYKMIDSTGVVTKEKVEDVLHKYFGKNVKFKHDDIKCYAGEVVYTYDEATGYTKKEHNGHGGPGSLGTELFYVSSEVNGNKVKVITKNLYERFCSDICGPMDAYYGRVDDVFENKNAVLKAENGQEEAKITRWNKDEVLEKVPETTYTFIIEDNGNYYLESVSISK